MAVVTDDTTAAASFQTHAAIVDGFDVPNGRATTQRGHRWGSASKSGRSAIGPVPAIGQHLNE